MAFWCAKNVPLGLPLAAGASASVEDADAPPVSYNPYTMWTKLMGGPRKKAPKTIAVIDPDLCFGAFACSICQAACPVANCIVEEPDRDGRMVCAVRADLCIGCGLCVTLGNPTAPQQREFGCPPDYDAINMVPFEDVVKVLREDELPARTATAADGSPAQQ
jgi:ferredoxin